MKPIFNSFDSNYKSPIGACKENSNIHFKIFINKNSCCRNLYLVILNDNFNIIKRYSMFWCGDLENNIETWECDFTPLDIGVLYYYFELHTDNGTKFVIRDSCGVGKIVESIDHSQTYFWQQTVYKKDFSTPSWIKGGIIYQIFPDRFFNSGKGKNNVPNDRTIKKDWYSSPAPLPDENGTIKNNDYYGGDLDGITLKLDYLKSLGVTCIYLNPIFEAHSNHRYNTANYNSVDPLLGSNKDFLKLCKKAKSIGIKIILDGVFSHTGSDSIYFNKENRYPKLGAYNTVKSPYYNWYKFSSWPNRYSAWWNFETLPEVDENNSDYCEFICGENGIIKKWLKLGASGWRLDVADELPDEFITKIRKCSKSYDKESFIIGEVWEDASNKESYSVKRKYLLGNELDSVMNYPFRNAIINFINEGNGFWVIDNILKIVEHYPKPVLDCLMNSLGTHDTERILNVILNKNKPDSGILTNKENNYVNILNKLFIAIAIQYTLPGVPCVYYGDECGLLGGKDPFCRATYPWGRENHDILNFYEELGKLRTNLTVLCTGNFIPYHIDNHLISYIRSIDNNSILCIFNMYNDGYTLKLPPNFKKNKILFGTAKINNMSVALPPYSFVIIKN